MILPPEDIINQIKEYAVKCGIDLLVFDQVPVIIVGMLPYPLALSLNGTYMIIQMNLIEFLKETKLFSKLKETF